MNQSPPRQRIIRNGPPPLVRRRQNTRRAQLPIGPVNQHAIIHPPILQASMFNLNNANKETIAYINANRLNNFNNNSNNNARMPVTKKRKLNNKRNNKSNKNKKNGNNTRRKANNINIYKVIE